MVQIINNHKSWPSLQQAPLNKHQSATANYRPGKPDILSKHASLKPDKLSQHAKHRQAIPACKAQTSYPSMHNRSHCIKGAARAQNSGMVETAKIAVGVRRAQYRKISRASTVTLEEARQGMMQKTAATS